MDEQSFCHGVMLVFSDLESIQSENGHSDDAIRKKENTSTTDKSHGYFYEGLSQPYSNRGR
jgi:hypothetical protein